MEFCVDFSKKSKSIREIYIYASERSCYALLKNGIVYSATTALEILEFKVKKCCYISPDSALFFIFNSLISHKGCLRHLEPYRLLRECNENFQIHVLNRFRFLAEVRAEFQKNALFWQFEDHHSWTNSETRQMTSFFSSTFPVLTVYNIHFFVWI